MVWQVIPQTEKGRTAGGNEFSDISQAGCFEPERGYKNPDGIQEYSYMVRPEGIEPSVFHFDRPGRNRDINPVFCTDGILGKMCIRDRDGVGQGIIRNCGRGSSTINRKGSGYKCGAGWNGICKW